VKVLLKVERVLTTTTTVFIFSWKSQINTHEIISNATQLQRLHECSLGIKIVSIIKLYFVCKIFVVVVSPIFISLPAQKKSTNHHGARSDWLIWLNGSAHIRVIQKQYSTLNLILCSQNIIIGIKCCILFSDGAIVHSEV
jgi:hypothetical protein